MAGTLDRCFSSIMPGAARPKCGEKTKWLAANPPNVFFLHRWTTLRRPRYNHRATVLQPAYGRWGPGHSPGGGRAAVRLSSRPLPVRAGHRWRVQVSLASRPNTCPCTPSARCPAQPLPPPCRDRQFPSRTRAPHARVPCGRLGLFLQGAGPRTTRRTASASLPTPCAAADGHPWTTPTLHPFQTSHNHTSIHLHLLQPSHPLPPAPICHRRRDRRRRRFRRRRTVARGRCRRDHRRPRHRRRHRRRHRLLRPPLAALAAASPPCPPLAAPILPPLLGPPPTLFSPPNRKPRPPLTLPSSPPPLKPPSPPLSPSSSALRAPWEGAAWEGRRVGSLAHPTPPQPAHRARGRVVSLVWCCSLI